MVESTLVAMLEDAQELSARTLRTIQSPSEINERAFIMLFLKKNEKYCVALTLNPNSYRCNIFLPSIQSTLTAATPSESAICKGVGMVKRNKVRMNGT